MNGAAQSVPDPFNECARERESANPARIRRSPALAGASLNPRREEGAVTFDEALTAAGPMARES